MENVTTNMTGNMTGGKFQMDQLPAGVALWVMALCAMDALVNAICLPVSALNFAMIAQTALLHRNLKFLLLLQSIGVSIFALAECLRIVPIMVKNDIFNWEPVPKAIFIVSLVCLIFIGWVAFGLLCERILATIKCRTYEEDRRPHFIIFSFLFICLATIGCYMTVVSSLRRDGGTKSSANALYEVYIFLISSFICMMIMFYLLDYNKRRYAQLEFVSDGNRRYNRDRLSMKYQLSENIRTSRQLLPSAFFHFAGVLLSICLCLLYYYGIMAKSALWNAVSFNAIFLLFAITHLGIQISVIIMHPMLNRQLRRMVGPILMAHLWKRKVGYVERGGGPPGATGRPANVPLNIFGKNLLHQNNDIGEYFKVLDTFWNRPNVGGGKMLQKRK